MMQLISGSYLRTKETIFMYIARKDCAIFSPSNHVINMHRDMTSVYDISKISQISILFFYGVFRFSPE